MREIGAFEAKNKLSALLDEVEQGQEIVITRHGKPVARLVPNDAVLPRDRAAEAAHRIRERACSLRASFDWTEWKRDRDEGRP
jgi:prevent-host-death family protein